MIKNKDLIYKVFFETKKEKLYYNQLKEITKLSYSSLQIVLKKLKENNEIKEEKTKSNTYYYLTNKCKAIEFTKITKEKIENLNLDVKIPLKEFIKSVPKQIFTIILFGSSSIREEENNSDIDLLIVLYKFEDQKLQKLYEKEVTGKLEQIKEEVNSSSIHPISLFITNQKDYLEKKDFIIKEATLKGFPIKNQIEYYENEN